MIRHKLAAVCAGLMLGAFFVFGGATPALADTLNGLDAASYQAGINASTVESDFFIAKATQGTGYTNPYWRTWADQTIAAGKKLGLYHYASGGNATAEADHFVNEVSNYSDDAILVLDWEGVQNSVFDSGSDASWVAQFRQEVYNRTGQWCLVYVSRSAIGLTGVDASHIWVAQYASNNAQYGYDSDPWHAAMDVAAGYPIRQYTSSGLINGWGGYLDLDVFYGDIARWDSYANGNPSQDTGEVKATYDYDIALDGVIGYNTTTSWQQQLHAGIVDGSISGHNSWRHKYAPAVTSTTWDKSYLYGSSFVKQLQTYLINNGYSCGSAGVDGYLGRMTIRAVQQYLVDRGYDVGSSGVDGYLGSSTARALQQSLNDDAWE